MSWMMMCQCAKEWHVLFAPPDQRRKHLRLGGVPGHLRDLRGRAAWRSNTELPGLSGLYLQQELANANVGHRLFF